MTIHQILQQYWGYHTFRPMQEDIIHAVMDGKDTLAIMPTGGGKSICFQVPAMAKDGICLVVSPLIALMKDQVANLKKRGIPALVVYSGMSFIETKITLQNAMHGNYKFLYVSPERLESKLFLEYLPGINVSLIVVDEAHCISQWGYDFRPTYLRIASLRTYFPSIGIIALSASATKKVQDDICEKLIFHSSAQRFQQSFERPNLSYSAFNVPSKQNKLLEIIRNVKGSAIVYCKSRKHTKAVAELLQLHTISADYYHAGLSNQERSRKQDDWKNNKTSVIACTNAFGMGIDKPDVRVVVHYDVPDCLENYYQEAGRAGRDGKRAYAVLLYNDRELAELEQQSKTRFPGKEIIMKLYVDAMNYLQLPAGYGEGVSYDFDLAFFSNAFKTDVVTVVNSIKVLEQEGVFVFNDVFFKHSSVVFTCTKNELNEMETHHPAFDSLIKSLLRSYEGVFDFPVNINESNLAKFAGITREKVVFQLKQLTQLGILAYSPQKERPQLTLLQNRMYADSILINLTGYLKRKELYEKRIAAMLAFTKNEYDCRSIQVAAYFNAPLDNKCGICDNCISRQSTTLSKDEFNQIATYILAQVLIHPLTVNELMQNLTKAKNEKFWKVLDFLQGEQKIFFTKEGQLVNKI